MATKEEILEQIQPGKIITAKLLTDITNLAADAQTNLPTLQTQVSELKSDLSKVENVLNVEERPSKNLIDKSKITYDAELVNTTGGIRTALGWYVTGWIPVEPNTKYTVSGISSYYRAETNIDDYQTAVYTGLGGNVATFTTGTNTKFVRFNSKTQGYDKPQLELGDHATEYEEYRSEKTYLRIDAIEKNIAKNTNKINASKYVHISLDDCVFWSDLIDNQNTYTSCFDNQKLAKLKEYHEEYGCVFTLNCFITDGAKSISNVPSKFAVEFAECKDWLKFAFHGTTDTETYETDNVDAIRTQYNTFVSAIYKMTGTYDCIDRVTRLSSYTGSLNNIIALRDCECGIVGLLTSDSDGTSYYLDKEKRTYINSHCKYYDADNMMTFIRTHQRLQQIINPTRMESIEYANYRPMVELFWHENNNWLDPYWITNFTKPWLEYLKEKGYVYAFSQDLIN